MTSQSQRDASSPAEAGLARGGREEEALRGRPRQFASRHLIESEFSENSAVLPRTWGTKMPLFSKHFYDNRQIPAS